MLCQNKYVYGIVEERLPKDFGFQGLEDARVYAIPYRDVAAVVSDVRLEEIDPTRSNVRAHTVVQEALLKGYTLLPMSFGTVASSEDGLRRLLEKNYEAVVGELKKLAGKVEGDLKIFWDENAVKNENQELFSKLKAKIGSASSPVQAQQLAIEAGMLIERIVQEWKSKYGQKIYDILRGFAVDARMNNPAGVKNLLNASFLLESTRQGEFVEQVRKLDTEHKGRLNFKYVGPLSPYSFVSIRLESPR